MGITYTYNDNVGLTKALMAKHLDHGFEQTFLTEATLLRKKPESFDMEVISEKLKDMTDATFNFVIALNGEELAGVLAVHPKDRREIQMLWVEEKYRKKGVGRKLVEMLSNEVKLPLKVECLKGNFNALGFYMKMGFFFDGTPRFEGNVAGYTRIKFD